VTEVARFSDGREWGEQVISLKAREGGQDRRELNKKVSKASLWMDPGPIGESQARNISPGFK
jgi:hypothetical protein